MSRAIDETPCPRCGQPIPATGATSEHADQLAVARVECPRCGAALVRAVEGHADQGWRLDDASG